MVSKSNSASKIVINKIIYRKNNPVNANRLFGKNSILNPLPPEYSSELNSNVYTVYYNNWYIEKITQKYHTAYGNKIRTYYNEQDQNENNKLIQGIK